MLVYSYVAEKGVELTVHKESVVVEKIKKVELRPRRVQLLMTEIIIELGYSHAPSKRWGKKLRRLLLKRRKVRPVSSVELLSFKVGSTSAQL